MVSGNCVILIVESASASSLVVAVEKTAVWCAEQCNVYML
jgi:hypothetical protein